MYHDLQNFWKNLLHTGLEEDDAKWDWTALGSIKSGDQKLSAKVIAKSAGIWAAQDLVAVLNEFTSIQTKSSVKNGSLLKPQMKVLSLNGTAPLILALERPFLNLASYVSGIATATHQLVQAVKKACPQQPPRVSMTRKTLPGYRDVAVYGVRVGGGFPHRTSLSGGILIKENHISAAGSIVKAIEGTRQVAPHGLKIEIEVRSISELKKAIQAKADGVLLDNFSPKEVHEALELIQLKKRDLFVEVSGGIDLSNIADYAISGVSVISVGATTHSVKNVDLSLIVE